MCGLKFGMRIIVTGDRRWYCPDLAEGVLNRLILRHGPSILIVHGGATGIDRSFAEACGEVGIDQEAHPADWGALDHPEAVIRQDSKGRSYNANAGPIRNQEMVDGGAVMCLAFHRAISSSEGTKDCCRRALAAGIPTWLIDSEWAEPKRLRAEDGRLR
jgi:YspA, cpYpsA-related SLOG family